MSSSFLMALQVPSLNWNVGNSPQKRGYVIFKFPHLLLLLNYPQDHITLLNGTWEHSLCRKCRRLTHDHLLCSLQRLHTIRPLIVLV